MTNNASRFKRLGVQGARWGVFLVAAALALPFSRLEAATPCRFEGQLAALERAGTDTAEKDPQKKLVVELTLRKELLARITGCAIEEARGLERTLDAITLPDRTMASVGQKLRTSLQDTISYYQFQKLKIGDLGLRGSKDFAQQLLEWRRNQYRILAENTANLLLWTKNQELLRTAEERGGQIERTVGALTLAPGNEIRVLLAGAREDLTNAQMSHRMAREAFLGIRSSDNVLDLTKGSLEHLAAAYEKFFEVSEAVTALLKPTRR